jgi:ubiquinone/menaquinone biosynthesis C-methylase UbiE
MHYFSLARRVPETSALEPKALAWLYDLISQVPLVRTVHRLFIEGVLQQGVMHGQGLDLGMGPGYVTAEIVRKRPDLKMVGLDLAAHMVERATQQDMGTSLNGQNLWLQGDGHRLPFADDSFDLVVSSFALHHWDDPLHVLNEIARVLRHPEPARGKPGGRYYIADVCREVNSSQRVFAYASIPAVSLPFGSYRGYGGYYESVRAGYTHDEARDLLDQSALPAGEVGNQSTWFVPIVTIASKGSD